MTMVNLKIELEKRNIHYTARAKKKDLVKYLDDDDGPEISKSI